MGDIPFFLTPYLKTPIIPITSMTHIH